MIPAEVIDATLIEFQNHSNGGVSALTTRVWPVAGLTTSSYGIPRTYFQCSRLTLSGSRPFGAKLPRRREAETTITYGTRTRISRPISNACEITNRLAVFCSGVIRFIFSLFVRSL